MYYKEMKRRRRRSKRTQDLLSLEDTRPKQVTTQKTSKP